MQLSYRSTRRMVDRKSSLVKDDLPLLKPTTTDHRLISYEKLNDLIDDLANQLSNLGISKGDRIATALPNGLEMPRVADQQSP